MRRATSAFWLLFTLTLPREALAVRPFDGGTAEVEPPRRLVLDVAPSGFLRAAGEPVGLLGFFGVSLGLPRRFELSAVLRDTLEPVPGLPRLRRLDSAASVAWLAYPGSTAGGRGPSLLLQTSALLPSFSRPQCCGGALTAVASQRLIGDTRAHFTVAGVADPVDADLFVALGLEGSPAWVVRPIGELFVERSRARFFTNSALVGALWSVTPSFSLDAAVRFASFGGPSGEAAPLTEGRLGWTASFDL